MYPDLYQETLKCALLLRSANSALSLSFVSGDPVLLGGVGRGLEGTLAGTAMHFRSMRRGSFLGLALALLSATSLSLSCVNALSVVK